MQSPTQSLLEQRRLLQIEYDEEKAAFSKATGRIGFTRLAERGNAWLRIHIGRTYYNSLNQRVVEIFRSDSADSDNEEDHNFEFGKPVAFFTISHELDDKPQFPFTGTVSFVDDNRMVVAIPESADTTRLASAPIAGIMLSFDETTYRTMFEAIDYTIKAKGRLAQLRDLFYSRRKAGELAFAPLRFPYLNKTQEDAVNKVLYAKDVAIVHGPPGTGKTTTLVEAINETLRRESQVLVCAQSNMAVDWICEKLVDRGIHVLRIGNPSRVNDKMLGFTYERRFEAHPDYPTLWSIRKAIRELQGNRKNRSNQWHQKMDRLRSRATELEIRINHDLFNSAHVIASTLVGSASRLLEGMKFSTLFIDEGAQALEAACWIPIRRAGRVIFAGDHCQLPPTVKSFEAMKGGLGKSLMECLVENHPEAVTLLTTQYRMNEEIMRFSSDWFYSGAMKAAPEVRYRGILDYDTPIEWIDTASASFNASPARENENDSNIHSDTKVTSIPSISSDANSSSEFPEIIESDSAFRESIAGESHGRINRDEALFSLLTLQNYIEKIGKERFLEERIDVGLISPYRAQVHYLRHLIKRTPFFKPFRHLISINTVDGFQGQERDVIVISLVRSNEAGNIGFLRDLRRMNVAMTRARMKLIIIGDVSTLTRHPFYQRLHTHIASISADT
ncbi:MAG: AAA family ATPase [Muribaculaceae bacterium]|nr:AAA family ATPase [Muribaculaceae bacterium]